MRFYQKLLISHGKTCLALILAVLAGCQSSPTSLQQHEPSLKPGRTAEPASPPRASSKPRARQATPEEPHTLWSRIRQGFLLDPALIDNPRIDQQRLAFLNQTRYFEVSGERAQRYLHYVVEQLETRELPQELALLPFVESSYNPMAYSSAHAAGLWQFIPSTGRQFSLRQDWWYDGRRDVVASTQAAMDYLTQLNERFDGDWLLALAAYNCGEGCVGRAIQRNQALNLPTDYWNLQLPRETMNYVPKLLALAQIIDSPTQHGAALPELPDEPYFAEITIEHQLELSKAAELADISTDELLRLNPAFKQRITAPQGTYQMLVPVDRAEQFSAALAALPEDQRVNYQRYQVRSGDTLSQIARRYQVSVGALREVNSINGNLIRVGQTLMLPRLGDSEPAPQSVATLAAATTQELRYQVQPGDNLWAIARNHGLSVNQIKQHNGLDSPALRAGQTLRLPAEASASQNRSLTYTVKSGDSLYSIARQFKVEIQNIRDWNQLGRHIRPGQQLTLFVP